MKIDSTNVRMVYISSLIDNRQYIIKTMDKKTKTIVVRVTDSELAQIKQKAAKYGMPMSSYLRMLGLTTQEEK